MVYEARQEQQDEPLRHRYRRDERHAQRDFTFTLARDYERETQRCLSATTRGTGATEGARDVTSRCEDTCASINPLINASRLSHG